MLFIFSLFAISTQAQTKSKKYYNSCAGQNAIYSDYEDFSLDDTDVIANKQKNKISTPNAALARKEAEQKLRGANSSTRIVKEVNKNTGKITERE